MKNMSFRIWDGKHLFMPAVAFDNTYYDISMTGALIMNTKSGDGNGGHLSRTIHGEELEKYDIIFDSGIDDINGVDIYEGHIVSTIGRIGIIVFEKGRFTLKAIKPERDYLNGLLSCDFNEHIEKGNIVKVLGNKYENPELLK